MHVTVRRATIEEAAAVAEVLCQSRRLYLPFAPMAHNDGAVHEWIAEVLAQDGRVYVAETSHEVVGMLVISSGREGGWIDQLYVRPGYTGHQVGFQLLQVAHVQLTSPIRLFTFQANTGARRFYERHGYKAVQFTDGADNEERCPDVLYEWRNAKAPA